jgi:hypothetical protein
MKQITEDEFYELYTPEYNQILLMGLQSEEDTGNTLPEDMCSFSGCMYETYGQEGEYVRSMIDQNRVVTIIEGEDEEGEDGEMHSTIFYESGYHFVNRIGYFVLDKPYTEEFSVKLDW